MADLIVHGGKPLSGTITPSGNKNSVLPILCATLLTDEKVTLTNVPNITDVEKLVGFFVDQGSRINWDRGAGRMEVDHSTFDAGRLDGLVNNAGILKDALLVKVKDGDVVGRMSLAQWQAVIDVNLTGVFLCGRAAAERMIRLGNGGVIVNISSISRHGNAGQTNYSAAKAGVAAMAVVWAQELARYGIRAASIAPGFVATDILSAMKPEMLDKMIAPVPLKRLGEAAEIARAARFIFESDFFTGRCLELDGGLRL